MFRLTSAAVMDPRARSAQASDVDWRESQDTSWWLRFMTSRNKRSMARCGRPATFPLGAFVPTRGDMEGRRKCMLGKGTMFMVMSFMSTLSDPSKRIPAVKFSSVLAASLLILS